MGIEENDDQAINLLEVQPDIPEQEPIEQVFSQEPEDVRTVEPSTESEDQERFEETAKFEDEIDTPKVEPKSAQKQARKTKVTRKSPKNESKNKPISKLHDELRKHSDARKKAEREILNIRKELKDVLLAHHATIKDLQKQVAQMHRKIAIIDRSKKSARVKTTAKKTTRVRKTSSNSKQSKKKSSQKKGKQKVRNNKNL
jgi:hypothetical protein